MLAVIEEQLSDSESDQDELFGPSGVYLATASLGDDGEAPDASHGVWIGSVNTPKLPVFEKYDLA